MALVTQLDPIYCDFTESSTELLRLRRELENGALKTAAPGEAKVTLLLDDGTTYPQPGKLLFSDVTVDPSSGMVTLRAEFPNPDHLLLPGMFARGVLEQAVDSKAITVPQRGVSVGADGVASVDGGRRGRQGGSPRDQNRPGRRKQMDCHRRIESRGNTSSSKACKKFNRECLVKPVPFNPAGANACRCRRRRPREINRTIAMPKFFIDRPIFAWVLSLLIMLAGILAITHLPVAQYPSVAPPSIAINANYAGASAETVQDTVTSVIEQQMNGIDNLLYMSSSSSASGQSTVTLYFQSGTDPDIAQVQVQNKLQLAIPNLPQTVQQQGITVRQIHAQLPDVFHAVHHQQGRERHRAGQFHFLERARPPPPRHRRGRSGFVRHAIRHAHLAEPQPARKLQSRAPTTSSPRFRPKTRRCRWDNSAPARR